ncbi:hypothetical protein LX87_01410 [Larkinella arboricola]|uniref:UPF0323 domain-containing protein n=1 Tax=Larkinella arboricola TaxID=643671 RepID=A0A327XAK6_LARAB|nr:hypothetical protein [Larkinella arboricola]RAK03288.1 hypothetical protein LX87_01410 [Larkinella arboricola]
MTPVRKHTILRRVKDITLSATLGLALLNGTAVLQSCGSSNDSETEQVDRAVSSERFGKGVRTYITETSPGNFKITDETEVDPKQAGAIVNYADGHRDTLSVEAARRLVQSDPSTSQYFNNPSGYHHSSGLSNVLLWGSLGYMLGRSNNSGFANEHQYRSGVYNNPQTFQRANSIGSNVNNSRISRPSGGRSGFFGGGRSRGFSS